MLDNLKIALRRQRRLIIIFFLTILIPSVSLGIFGIRAIKNERFRLARQIDDAHRRTAESIKFQVATSLGELEAGLESLAGASAFNEKNISEIPRLIREKLGKHPLVESVFLVYGEEEPFFPLFQPAPRQGKDVVRPAPLKQFQQKLNDAEENEFVRRNLKSAVLLYRELAEQSKDHHVKARMINNEARCLMKLGRYQDAIRNYGTIDGDYQDSMSSSGSPLGLIGRIQTVACYRELKDLREAAAEALLTLEDILLMRWDLNESQFNTYVELSREAIEEILAEIGESEIAKEFEARYVRSNNILQEKLHQWSAIRAIREDIVPDIRRRLSISSRTETSLHYAKSLGDGTFLILAESIPDHETEPGPAFVGIRIDSDALLVDIRFRIEQGVGPAGAPNVIISDLEGRILLGERNPEKNPDAVTGFFEDNFPPWKIEVFRGPSEGLGFTGLKGSFYFWTIITLVVILTFGTILIARTIAHEMEILKLKSEFVASVSHEFKTPLTSMRALLERLQGGKVKDARRMDEYFSLLSRNTDQLARLVKNLLDFSKIEEGKREYHFAPTDVAELVSKQVREFGNEALNAGVEVRVQAEQGIPMVSLDREGVLQAVSNLLDNAAKFSPGRTSIAVRVGRDEGHVFVEVADRGIGIPQDELDKVFEKFYQGRNAVRQSARGTGLGLTLVKHTVEAHGGKITVKSRPGEGSTFRLTFPIQDG